MQGILATDLAGDLNSWIGKLADGPVTIYDRAMDAEYLSTHVGGSLHRLFDGGHTVTGAFKAARDASPDDNIIQEAWGTVLGLFRDGVTPRGLPIFSWDKDAFDGIASTLDSISAPLALVGDPVKCGECSDDRVSGQGTAWESWL